MDSGPPHTPPPRRPADGAGDGLGPGPGADQTPQLPRRSIDVLGMAFDPFSNEAPMDSVPLASPRVLPFTMKESESRGESDSAHGPPDDPLGLQEPYEGLASDEETEPGNPEPQPAPWASSSSLDSHVLEDEYGGIRRHGSPLGDAFDAFHIQWNNEGEDSDQARLMEHQEVPSGAEVPPAEANHLRVPGGTDEENPRLETPSPRRSAAYASSALNSGIRNMRSGFERASRRVRRASQRLSGTEQHDGQVWLQMKESDDSPDSEEETPSIDVDQRPISKKLRGKSLGLFGPTHPLRQWAAQLISSPWFEPLILALVGVNLVVLCASAARDAYTHPLNFDLLTSSEQVILLAVFCVYTVEVLMRIIVSGLVINPPSKPEDVTEPVLDTASAKESPMDLPPDPTPWYARSNTRTELRRLQHRVFTWLDRKLHPYSKRRDPAPEMPAFEYAVGNVTNSPGEVYPPVQHVLVPPQDVHIPQGGRRTWYTAMVAWLRQSASRLTHAITAEDRTVTDRAYLRQSWNRVDIVAVVFYWVAMALEVSHRDGRRHHIFVFRALSVLRCARILTLSNGTATILASIKRVAPLLLRVTYFVIFAMVLFAVVGIQSFKGSYRRSCIWVGSMNNEPGFNYTLDHICGGSVDPADGSRTVGHYTQDGRLMSKTGKGFICPAGQLCVEQDSNPYNNAQSFDSVVHSLVQIAVVISLNGWSDTMYDMVDADYYTAVIFFIVGIILLNFWLANLFVAVITHSFAALSAQTEHSAFAAIAMRPTAPAEQEEYVTPFRMRRRRIASYYKRYWGYTKYLWLAAVLLCVGFQGSQTTYQFPAQRRMRDRAEQALTIAFDVEIILRFLAYLLDSEPREFLRSKQNSLDLFLAVITSIIQIGAIKHSRVYAWLTFFQLARFYRIIAAIPRLRVLLARMVGSMSALVNMVVFLTMTIFLAALFSVQIFRGDIDQEAEGSTVEMTWKHLFNAFLAVYQIFSSENWSDTMFNVIGSERRFGQPVVSGIFLIGWFFFANFIILQMFIAVINENFRVAEGDKYRQQMERYLQRTEPPRLSRLQHFLRYFSPFRSQRQAVAAMSEAEAEAGNEREEPNPIAGPPADANPKKGQSMFWQMVVPDAAGMAVSSMQRMLRLDSAHEKEAKRAARGETRDATLDANRRTFYQFEHVYYEQDEEQRLLSGRQQLRNMRSDLGLTDPTQGYAEFQENYVHRANADPRIRLARVIAEHPSFDRTWFIFSNRSHIRRFCQSLTPPAHGERLFGRQVSKLGSYVFKTAILLAIVGSVVVAGIATPLYRKKWVAKHGTLYASWFSILEISLSILFILEFFVKTIADGFAFTPNAYLLNPWNWLDLFVLISLVVNVVSELVVYGGVSHFTRALKAFRALRLINLSALLRDTFHAVIIAGAGRIFDAAVLSLLYIIPYAVWGQNLFAGLLYSCNDQSPGIATKLDCHGEFSAKPLHWTFLAPRTWRNPTEGSQYSFDDFKSALLILFEIMSLEGWVDVMTAAMSIVGRDKQPQPDAQEVNALFFLVYNLIGAISVLTLFVSVIIENFQRYSGAAYLTTQQRQWLDLKRQLRGQRASKRPKSMPSNPYVRWCYMAATQKQGWWLRSMLIVPLAVLIVLMTQHYPEPAYAELVRHSIYLGLALVYALDILVRFIGLGWTSFRRSLWNLYDVVVVLGVIGTTVPLLVHEKTADAHVQLQKIFLTGMSLKLVQRNDALNQLFKTAISSVPAIVSLFLLWLTMFLVWAIMLVEVFGLTKWGANETHAKNFTTLWGTLIVLSMMSTGEGWNQYMHDYAVESPLCTESSTYLNSDCGSQPWAYFLFITWNIISMFIFLNMFTGTVVENFSYVFHLQGSTRLSRTQMRLFKETWAQFDAEGSGYISAEQVAPFLSRLKGMFDVGIYPPDLRVPVLLERSRVTDGSTGSGSPSSSPRPHFNLNWLKSPLSPRPPGSPLMSQAGSSPGPSPGASPGRSSGRNLGHSPGRTGVSSHSSAHDWFDQHVQAPPLVESGVDMTQLSRLLSRMNVTEIRMRRERFNRMYHEALATDKGKGVSFTSMLFVIAYHKMCSKPTNMEVAEFIERRELLDSIDNAIRLERVRGLLRMVYLRRRFLATHAGARFTHVAVPGGDEHGIPAITVESEAGSPQRNRRPNLWLNTDVVHRGILPDHASDMSGGSLHLRTPSTPRSEENGDVALMGPADVYLSPLSVGSSSRRRRSSAQHEEEENPFQDPGSISSRDQEGEPGSSQPFDDTTWSHVMRRLEAEE